MRNGVKHFVLASWWWSNNAYATLSCLVPEAQKTNSSKCSWFR